MLQSCQSAQVQGLHTCGQGVLHRPRDLVAADIHRKAVGVEDLQEALVGGGGAVHSAKVEGCIARLGIWDQGRGAARSICVVQLGLAGRQLLLDQRPAKAPYWMSFRDPYIWLCMAGCGLCLYGETLVSPKQAEA